MRKLIGIFLTLLSLVCIATSTASAANVAAKNSIPNPPISFVTTGSYTLGAKSVTVTLQVRSLTDKPVPGVTVVIGNCKYGQQTPLQLTHRTRHLDANRESLALSPNGKLVWLMQEAPDNTQRPATLRLSFAIPQGMGGPYLCWKSHALTMVSLKPTSTHRIVIPTEISTTEV